MKLELLEFEKELLNENSAFGFNADIRIDSLDNINEPFISDNFLIKDRFLESLFTVDPKCSETEFKEKDKNETKAEYCSDKVIITGWKNVENISTRLIDIYDDKVLIECLIDKENGLYEEREFRVSFFDGYELKIGNLFLLRIFERRNEMRIEIHNDPGLTLKDDFPIISFVESFQGSSLIKKKQA